MSDAEFLASDPVFRGLAQQILQISEAIPLADAAARMGLSDARLRQRISEGSLLAVHRPHGRGWLIPTFQITGSGEIPHLGRILKAVARPVSDEAMHRFFVSSHDDLHGMSPRDWLIEGRDPSILEGLLASL
ncbi:hypothetical protein [Tropicimonas sp. IMCC34011]|uniref:hypothetical protein n=1 Tax=Tropicimonas sp. IMCC34011 TaxID=2248759 RepID=UPI000E24FF9B|nr:hypothetical protein [Tropicimonas sp. IMCC34011]